MKTFLKFLTLTLFLFAGFSAKADYTQHWWDPAKNGMGVPIHQQGNVIVATWFMYETTGQPSFLSFAGALTKDSQGRDQFSGDLYRTTSSAPAGYDPSRKQSVPVGVVLVTWNGSTSATMQYSFSGQQGTLNLVPYVFAASEPVIKYTDKVYAIWTGGYPYAVSKTGVVKVDNKTRYTTGALPLFNCWMGYPQLSNGKILSQCQDAVSLQRHTFYVDPMQEALFEYTGAVPSNIIWRDVEPFDPAKPEWATKARVSDGWYFTPFDQTSVLKFQADAGQVTTIRAGTFAVDGDIRVLLAYTN